VADAAAEVKMPCWVAAEVKMPRLGGCCRGQDAASLGNIKAYLYSSIIIIYTLFETTKSHILIWIKIKWKFFFLVT
jgi:hypothetical protein